MIDSVRNTVLAIMNKNNYGYLTPSDFNLYARQAQIDIFKGYFKKYTDDVNRENTRMSGTGYAGNSEKTQLEIDVFITEPLDLSCPDDDNKFLLPSPSTTGYELYKIEKVLCYNISSPEPEFKAEAHQVSMRELTAISMSNLTAPSISFPVYSVYGNKMTVLPDYFSEEGSVKCSFVRLPVDPKWTYREFSSGVFVFNPSANDYVDFEIGPDEESSLVFRILQYAGVAIREADVYNFGKSEVEQEKQ